MDKAYKQRLIKDICFVLGSDPRSWLGLDLQNSRYLCHRSTTFGLRISAKVKKWWLRTRFSKVLKLKTHAKVGWGPNELSQYAYCSLSRASTRHKQTKQFLRTPEQLKGAPYSLFYYKNLPFLVLGEGAKYSCLEPPKGLISALSLSNGPTFWNWIVYMQSNYHKRLYLSHSKKMFSLCLHSNHELAEMSSLYLIAWLNHANMFAFLYLTCACNSCNCIHACTKPGIWACKWLVTCIRNTQFLCTIMVNVCATIKYLGVFVFCIYICIFTTLENQDVDFLPHFISTGGFLAIVLNLCN